MTAERHRGASSPWKAARGRGSRRRSRGWPSWLEGARPRGRATREPGGSPGAEMIRKLLVEGPVERWDGTTEALLHFAARARASALDRVAGAEARRLGDERPLRRFDPRLSGLRPWRSTARCSMRLYERRGRRLPARPDPDPRPAGRDRGLRAPPRGAARRRATRACRAISMSGVRDGLPRDRQARARALRRDRCRAGHRRRRRRHRARRRRAAGSLSDGARQGERRSGRAGEARMAVRLAAAVAQRAAGRPRAGRDARCWRPSSAARCTMPGC